MQRVRVWRQQLQPDIGPRMTIRMYVESAGLLGPGLAGWAQSRAVLTGAAPHVLGEVRLTAHGALPPVERRRVCESVKLALTVGMEAVAATGRSPDGLATIFASSAGDGSVIHEICESLARPEREVSPTRFHNSVHNAPAGYWSIATRSHAPSMSLCAYEWSFAAGLIEAGSELATGSEALLLVSYDLPYPPPLSSACPITGVLGAALLLVRERTAACLAQLQLRLEVAPRGATRLQVPSLEALRAGNATGRALPLLHALSASRAAEVVLDYLGTGSLAVEVTPC